MIARPQKQHKYRFGVNGNPLKLYRRIVREKRTFPKNCKDTMDYVKQYFALNNYFVGVDYV